MPVKSIKIMDDKAEIIKASCLNCGQCITVCSKGAKLYIDSIQNVEQILKSNKKTALVLAPSYVIVAVKKYHATPEQFCTALKKLGFDLVYESSFGADLLTKVYLDYVNELVKTKGKENAHVIASPCPSLMNFVEKHAPELIEEFAPVLSPMAAQAVLAKHWNEGSLAIIGGSPCVAKKSELLDRKLGLFEDDLTFEEISKMIDRRGLVPSRLEESEFDGIQCYYGAGFPISGGLTKTLELFSDLEVNPISNDILILEGEDRSTEFLENMARKKRVDKNLRGYPVLIDILYCEGCIAGKAMGFNTDILENKRIISDYTLKRFQKAKEKGLFRKYKGYKVLTKNTVSALEFKRWLKTVDQLIKDNKFTRTWDRKPFHKRMPNEHELKAILESDGKYSVEDELNCGACGYFTCRERAIAVFNGENDLGGCIVHQKHEAKKLYAETKTMVSDTLRRSTEGLLSSINDIRKGNLNNADISSRLLENITSQGSDVKHLQEKITTVIKSFDYVSEMANNIAGIADQTKMLSLNAQIEAARAGEVGRGFAVVAEQVEKLSRDTHERVKAVNEFNSQIGKVQKELDVLISQLITKTEQVGGLADSQASVANQINVSSEELFNATESIKAIID